MRGVYSDSGMGVWILIDLPICSIHKMLNYDQKQTEITHTLHEHLSTFMTNWLLASPLFHGYYGYQGYQILWSSSLSRLPIFLFLM